MAVADGVVEATVTIRRSTAVASPTGVLTGVAVWSRPLIAVAGRDVVGENVASTVGSAVGRSRARAGEDPDAAATVTAEEVGGEAGEDGRGGGSASTAAANGGSLGAASSAISSEGGSTNISAFES